MSEIDRLRRGLEHSIDSFRSAAAAAGRDPSQLLIVVCGSSYGTWRDADKRPPLNGSIDEVRRDLDRMRELEVNHVYFGVNYENTPLDDQLRRMEHLAALLH